MTAKYRRIVIEQTGAPEVMHLVEDEIPTPAAGQARVKVLAADVSFSDVNLRRGRYPGAPPVPFTPGYAMVGVVDALAPGINAPAPGQMVAALTFYGSYSQYLCVPAESLVRVPPGVDSAEAVSLVLSYVAAYQMLHRLARVRGGDRILVHGAAGAVGTAFLDLARVDGLIAYGTVSRPKQDVVLRLGGTPIDYRAEDFVTRTLALTNRVGVDAAFDAIGAAHLAQSEQAVRRGGAVVAYGYYEAADRGANFIFDVIRQRVELTIWSLPPRRKRVAFYDIRSLEKRHPAWFKEDLGALLSLLADGKLHPVIAARLPLESAVDAHRMVENAEVQGKVVLIPN